MPDEWSKAGSSEPGRSEAESSEAELVDAPWTEPEPGVVHQAVTGAMVGMLVLLGITLGVVGGFLHAWYLGDVPIAALCWLVILFAVPYGMGALADGRLGALAPAAGWFVASFTLATRQSEGDLAIMADSAGYWYLYGGTLAVAIAVVATRSTGSWLLRSHGGS